MFKQGSSQREGKPASMTTNQSYVAPAESGTLAYKRPGRGKFVPPSLVPKLGLFGIGRSKSPPAPAKTSYSLTFHKSLAIFRRKGNVNEDEDAPFGNGSCILKDDEGSEIFNLNEFLQSLEYEEKTSSWIHQKATDGEQGERPARKLSICDSIVYHHRNLQNNDA